MKSSILLFALLFAVILVQGYARTDRLADSTHMGTVEALFEEAHPGVYVPRRSPDLSGAPVWAHVSFPQALADGRTYAVAVLPHGLTARVGDTVEMRFGDPNDVDRQGPERNLIMQVLPATQHRLAGVQ